MDLESAAKTFIQFYSCFCMICSLITSFLLQTRRAEVKLAVSMVEHNVPFAVADHFSPLLKECFKDSPTAQSFKAARTKMSCIINEAVAPHFRKELVMKMRTNPFTLITDGSNDTGHYIFQHPF